MSADEATAAMVAQTQPSSTPAPPTSTADLAVLLQQIQAVQAAQAAAQQQQQAPHVPVVTTAATSNPNPLANLEAILNTASLANIATVGGLNPLSMLALTSSLNQTSPVYQGIARVLLTMNMGQMIATQQTSELLATMNQQDALMAILAARSGMNFPFPGQQQQNQQQNLPQQGGFAVPQVPHMSLKRSNKDQLSVNGGSDRKKSCPPMAMIGGGGHQGQQTPQQQQQQVVAPPPVAPRPPSPPRKSAFENLPPEMKETNEKFRKEILRRLDVILLEEFGTEDEEDEKKPDLKQQILTSDEDDSDDSKFIEERERTSSIGSKGSAFRVVLSRSSTMGKESGSPSASGTTTPSTGSLSSGPDSPPIEGDPLSPEFIEMLTAVAKKHKDQSENLLSLQSVDEASFVENFPLLWCGELLLKSNKTTINLHMVNGSRQFLSNVLGQVTSDGPAHRDSIRITQRLRIDNGQIEHIHRILTNPDYACAIGLSAATDKEKMLTEQAILQTHFQDYLQSKQIAGISRLDSDELNRKARVHVFAPCDLVNKYLAELAPKLYEHLTDINAHFLFFVFTNDEAIPNMTNPPTKDSLVAPANN